MERAGGMASDCDQVREIDLASLFAEVSEFHIIIGLKDKIENMLRLAYALGCEHMSENSCGCV